MQPHVRLYFYSNLVIINTSFIYIKNGDFIETQKISGLFPYIFFSADRMFHKDQSQSLSMTGTYFDTVVKIEVWGADSKIMDGCKDICEKYEQLLSPTIDSSEISQINQAQGASVSVSKETADLIELGKYYGDLSGGI